MTVRVREDIPTMRGPDFAADVNYLAALGALVRASATLDSMLQQLYCALKDDKEAARTVGSWPTSTLLKKCETAVAAEPIVDDTARNDLNGLLGRAKVASDARHRFVHDEWGGGPNDSMQLKRDRDGYGLALRSDNLDQLIDCAREVNLLGGRLLGWATQHLGVRWLREGQLRWEDEQNGR